MTENGELALSSSPQPCDRGHLSVGECRADTRHATRCCVTYDHPCYFWWVLCVSGAGMKNPEPFKVDVVVVCDTQKPFPTQKAVYTHKCIYTQAYTCIHINTCPGLSEHLNTVMFKWSVLRLEGICCIAAAKPKLLNWKLQDFFSCKFGKCRKVKYTQNNNSVIVYSSSSRWKVRWSFVVLKTFLELHSKTALQCSSKKLKLIGTCF